MVSKDQVWLKMSGGLVNKILSYFILTNVDLLFPVVSGLAAVTPPDTQHSAVHVIRI